MAVWLIRPPRHVSVPGVRGVSPAGPCFGGEQSWSGGVQSFSSGIPFGLGLIIHLDGREDTKVF
jgi:hypothetical protein